MRPILKVFSLFLLASLVCSCASTSVVDTWRNPILPRERLHRILVVCICKKDANRRVYEDVISSELTRRGANAIAGYTQFPTEGKSDWPALEQAMKKSSADAVLTVQTVRVEQQTIVQPGYSTVYPGYWYPQAFPSWSLYGYYGSTMYYEPPYVSTYDVATLQANLFDAKSGKLIWAATLQSSEPENIVPVSKDIAKLVSEALRKEGLI